MKQSNTKNRDVLRILGLPRAYLHTYFKEKECMTRQHKNWSVEEDNKLMKAMSNYGSDWKVIVSMFAQTKSKQQILDRVNELKPQLADSSNVQLPTEKAVI